MSELGPTRTYSDIGGTDSGHVRNVSARKRLRELLDDEPKVKWIEENPGVTYWSDGTHAFIAEEYGDGKLEVKTLMTPEQAIAATMGDIDATTTRQGVGTCKPHGEWERASQTQEVRRLVCDCGEELGMEERGTLPWRYHHRASLPNYCPNCGRKMVDE